MGASKAGQGQVVLLSGDAGIGKSRLVHMLKEHVANETHTCWECRSSPYFDNTALFPLTDMFQRLLQWQPEDTPDEKLAKLEQTLSQYRLPLEESVPLFAPLLALPLPEHHYPPLNLSPPRQRQKTLETIVAILLELAERQPVLFILEDLHWADPTTLELLHLVIEQIPTTSSLTVLTCRPHFQPAWHHRSYLTEIAVNRLSPPQVEQFVNRMTEGTPSHKKCSHRSSRRRMASHCLLRKSRKPWWNQNNSKPSMGTTNSSDRSPHSPFLRHCKTRSWRDWTG